MKETFSSTKEYVAEAYPDLAWLQEWEAGDGNHNVEVFDALSDVMFDNPGHLDSDRTLARVLLVLGWDPETMEDGRFSELVRRCAFYYRYSENRELDGPLNSMSLMNEVVEEIIAEGFDRFDPERVEPFLERLALDLAIAEARTSHECFGTADEAEGLREEGERLSAFRRVVDFVGLTTDGLLEPGASSIPSMETRVLTQEWIKAVSSGVYESTVFDVYLRGFMFRQGIDPRRSGSEEKVWRFAYDLGKAFSNPKRRYRYTEEGFSRIDPKLIRSMIGAMGEDTSGGTFPQFFYDCACVFTRMQTGVEFPFGKGAFPLAARYMLYARRRYDEKKDSIWKPAPSSDVREIMEGIREREISYQRALALLGLSPYYVEGIVDQVVHAGYKREGRLSEELAERIIAQTIDEVLLLNDDREIGSRISAIVARNLSVALVAAEARITRNRGGVSLLNELRENDEAIEALEFVGRLLNVAESVYRSCEISDSGDKVLGDLGEYVEIRPLIGLWTRARLTGDYTRFGGYLRGAISDKSSMTRDIRSILYKFALVLGRAAPYYEDFICDNAERTVGDRVMKRTEYSDLTTEFLYDCLAACSGYGTKTNALYGSWELMQVARYLGFAGIYGGAKAAL